MIGVSRALLSTFGDMEEVAKIAHEETVQYDDGETAIVFMGHGTEAASNRVYADMQDTFNKLNYKNYFMGTVEAEPSLEDVVKAAKDGGYKRVVLEPLMIVCGDHANNDMAGDEEDSWKSIFEGAGYEVECVVEGLGQLEAIQELILAHAADAILNQVK
jgi:sirohydrochlorin cobaltochelatase